MNRSLRLIAAAMTGLILGCQADDQVAGLDPARGPGALEIRLVTPNAEDGALLLTLSGGPVDSITSAAFEIVSLPVSANDHRVLIRGALRSGIVARLWVPERENQSAYVVSVTEAVGRTSYARRDVAGYAVSVGLNGNQ